MRKLLYLFAEMMVLYVFAAGAGAFFLWITLGLSGTIAKFLLILNMIVMIPFAIRGVLIGFTKRNLAQAAAFGFYHPVRPIAWLLPAFRFAQDGSDLPGFGHRRKLHFELDPAGPGDAYDVIAALSSHLDQQGITHTNMGKLSVRDNSATWELEPMSSSHSLEGWVEARDPADRMQVIDGLKRFLARSGHPNFA